MLRYIGNCFAVAAAGLLVACGSSNGDNVCNSDEALDAASQYARGMEICGPLVEQGVGSNCMRDLDSGFEGIYDSEIVRCAKREYRRYL